MSFFILWWFYPLFIFIIGVLYYIINKNNTYSYYDIEGVIIICTVISILLCIGHFLPNELIINTSIK